MAIFDYNKDIVIDPDQLDVEWLQQPTLFLKYSNKATQARKEADILKEKVDFLNESFKRVQMQAGLRARSEEGTEAIKNKYGKDVKLVEKTFDAFAMEDEEVITISKELREAKLKLIDANEEAGLWDNASKAFDQRKKSLENLVYLHGQQYFAGPAVPRDLRQKNDDYLKEKKMAMQRAKEAIKERGKKRK